MFIPVLSQISKRKTIIDIASFTQSLGAELLVNGNFAAFTTDNPNGWTVVGEVGTDPEVSEVGAGEAHGGAGTGMVNLFSSATASAPAIQQTILTVGDTFESKININLLTSGQLAVSDTSGGLGSKTYTTAGEKEQLARALATTFRNRGSAPPNDATIASNSVKKVTLNSVLTAMADGTFQFQFVLPVSPVAGQRIEKRVRANATTPTLDYNVAYLRRNDANTAWDFRYDRVTTGTETNMINITGVGTPTLLKVVALGNLQDAFTGTGTIDAPTYTQRGTQQNNATNATNTGLYTVYSSATTPERLKANV